MENEQDEQIFYYVSIGDIQDVAEEEIGRNLSDSEIESIKDIIAERINWYDPIAQAIHEMKFTQ
jgi:hypothetical protein